MATIYQGFYPAPCSVLMLFIPELFGPVLECLTLDWPAQDCPAGRFAFFCPRRPTRFDLLLDGFSGPRQIHLYLNSHLKGPRDLLVAVHALGTYIFTTPPPKAQISFTRLLCGTWVTFSSFCCFCGFVKFSSFCCCC